MDSIRLVVLTVSPNKQYLGIFKPTTPAQTGPKIRKKNKLIEKYIICTFITQHLMRLLITTLLPAINR